MAAIAFRRSPDGDAPSSCQEISRIGSPVSFVTVQAIWNSETQNGHKWKSTRGRSGFFLDYSGFILDLLWQNVRQSYLKFTDNVSVSSFAEIAEDVVVDVLADEMC